jgi:hypothetical protein
MRTGDRSKEMAEMKAREMVLARKNTYTHALSDWTELSAGDPVEVFKNAQLLASGYVEEVSLSGRVLGILQEGTVGSAYFLKSDGVLVRRS